MALVELASFANSFEAGIVRGLLEAAGIEAHMFDLNMTVGGGGIFVPVRLMVAEADLAEARRIIDSAGSTPV